MISANIKCSNTGIVSQSMDSSHVSMVCFEFTSDMFSYYECNDTIILGVNFVSLSRILKVVEKDDMVGIETISNDKLSVQIKNKNSGKEWCFDLKLMEIDSDELEIPPLPDGWRIKFNTLEFAKDISTMSSFSDIIEIGIKDGKLVLKADGDIGSAILDATASHEWVGDTTASTDVVLHFTSTLLTKYGSGKNLASSITILLAPDHPLMLKYDMGGGMMMAFIAPKMEDS